MATNAITALMVAPKLNPVEVKLYKDREFIRAAVSICCDGLYPVSILPLGSNVCILYNSEFQLFTTQCNRRIADMVISGVFYIVGLKDGKLASLSADDVEFYKTLLWEPDEFSEDDRIEAYLDSCGQNDANRISRSYIYI